MKTTVICEIGSNWETLDDILYSCEWAVSRGCLPKLQAWQTDLVVNKDRHPAMYEVMKKYELPKKWIKKISRAFPETFYSVFDLKTLRFLEDAVRPKHYKIASPDCVYEPLLSGVASTNSHTFVSIGGANLDEIRICAKHFEWSKITLMECNASYPATKAYLGNLRDRIIGSRLMSWGYSDHTLSLIVPSTAVALGATAVEKHFKLREFSSPDNRHSVGQLDFGIILDHIKDVEYNMGTLEHPFPEERNTLELARRKEDGRR